MGGCGSGSWYRYDSKPTVESCWTIDAVRLMHGRKALVPGAAGSINWSDPHTGKALASVGYILRGIDGALVLDLKYTMRGESIDCQIRLTRTLPHLGGVRWWFICPLVRGETPCRRRVRKLHLRHRYFGCRHCHGLTYASCQESHQAERAIAHLTDAALMHRLRRLWAMGGG